MGLYTNNPSLGPTLVHMSIGEGVGSGSKLIPVDTRIFLLLAYDWPFLKVQKHSRNIPIDYGSWSHFYTVVHMALCVCQQDAPYQATGSF